MSETILSETILSERTNKCLKVTASPARSFSDVSWTDINFWSLLGLPALEQHRQERHHVTTFPACKQKGITKTL
jgi:hypothetical protein